MLRIKRGFGKMIERITMSGEIHAQAYDEKDRSAKRYDLSKKFSIEVDTPFCDFDAITKRVSDQISSCLRSAVEKKRQEARESAKLSNHEAAAWEV